MTNKIVKCGCDQFQTIGPKQKSIMEHLEETAIGIANKRIADLEQEVEILYHTVTEAYKQSNQPHVIKILRDCLNKGTLNCEQLPSENTINLRLKLLEKGVEIDNLKNETVRLEEALSRIYDLAFRSDIHPNEQGGAAIIMAHKALNGEKIDD